MSYANLETFPRVLLEHPAAVSTIAIVGLIHVIPRNRAYMFQEVGEFAQARLQLPNSVVHYEFTKGPTDEEKEEFRRRRPATYDKLVRIEELEEESLDILGLIHQSKALYEVYVTDSWKNHDLKEVDWAYQIHDDELDEDIRDLEEYREKILVLSDGNKDQYNEKEFVLCMEESFIGCEMTPFDRLREVFAVDAVIEESKQGMKHFTLLWGLGHLANLQTAFEGHGYRLETDVKTISGLAK